MDASDVLHTAHTILLVDFPSRDVPDTLARAGFSVIAQGGPGPEDYFSYERQGTEVVQRRVGESPPHADLVYVHRPLDELPAIVDHARDIRATAVWCQAQSAEARQVIEAAGLIYVDHPSIVEAARTLKPGL
jgi:predicted CoA-binding protein